jgi:hypothetical protein
MPKIEDNLRNPLICQNCKEYMSIAIDISKVKG